jgi:hypothetical protein
MNQLRRVFTPVLSFFVRSAVKMSMHGVKDEIDLPLPKLCELFTVVKYS